MVVLTIFLLNLCLMLHYRKIVQGHLATITLKYLAVTKSLIKLLFIYKMNKSIFQETAKYFIPGCHVAQYYHSRYLLPVWRAKTISSPRAAKEQTYVFLAFVSLVWRERVITRVLLCLVYSLDALKHYFIFAFSLYSSLEKNKQTKPPILTSIQFKYFFS